LLGVLLGRDDEGGRCNWGSAAFAPTSFLVRLPPPACALPPSSRCLQEEVLLSVCMAFAICNLLASLSADNSSDYVCEYGTVVPPG
jgi:hypothetical protein